MEKTRNDLRTCPVCQVLNSPTSFRCYGCGLSFVKDPKQLQELCDYYDEIAESCGVSDCVQGCCLSCDEADRCLFQCFRSRELG